MGMLMSLPCAIFAQAHRDSAELQPAVIERPGSGPVGLASPKAIAFANWKRSCRMRLLKMLNLYSLLYRLHSMCGTHIIWWGQTVSLQYKLQLEQLMDGLPPW